MSGGYTPVFDTVFTGTLHGQWPDLGLWLCMLALSDKHGHVDCTPQYIASVTGLHVEAIVECIERFMKIDPFSRTPICDGRRLELIDANRPWGWKIINHTKYREKARLSAKNEKEITSGKNAERMDDRRRPPETAADPLSDSYTNTNIKNSATAPVVEGLDLKAWGRWERYRTEIRKPIKPASMLAAQRKLAGFGTSQSAVVENSIAEGYTGLFPAKPNGIAKKSNYANAI